MYVKRLISIIAAALLVAGCPGMLPRAAGTGAAGQAGEASRAAQAGAVPLSGQISHHLGYHVQLTDLLNDFAKGATVSLIEIASGETKGASLADDQGRFLIHFGSTFEAARPTPDSARSVGYYLEAVRGVKGANDRPNQAGADAIRLRTLVWYDFEKGGWVSLANQDPGSLSISLSTTTVAFFVNQKLVNKETVNAEAFIGSIDPQLNNQAPNDYTVVGELSAAIYGNLLAQVANAVSKDQDPIHTLILTSGGSAVNTLTDVQVSGINPSSGTIGDIVMISGVNFDPRTVEVAFVGATAFVDEAQSSANTLRVTVPPGARSGLIRVSMGGKDTYTQPFKVTTDDGHRITFIDPSGNTYLFAVANSMGSVLRINPDGSTRTFGAALSDPRAVLVNPEGAAGPGYKFYVANAGTNRIVQLDQNGSVTNADWLTAAVPSAIVLGPDGSVYVAQRSAGTILRATVDWSTSTVTSASKAVYTGFTDPTALAFDYAGNLYVVERSQGRVRRFNPASGDAGSMAPAMTDWAFLSDPDGIAIDTGGNSFITSSTNNVVFRVDRFRNMSAFKTIAGARSIARDAAGNLYVAEASRNLIQRLTLAGDQKIVAYGLAGLRGVAVDGPGNLYVSLRDSGAILKLSSDGVTASPLIAGIAAPDGITFRNDKLYVAHTDTHNATEVGLNGSARSVIPSGLYGPGGIEASDDGQTFYAGRLNYGDCWSCGLPKGGSSIDQSGIDVVSSGNIQWRHPLIWYPDYDWNGTTPALAQIDANTFIELHRGSRRLVLTRSHTAGTYAQKIVDFTPTISGSRAFPSEPNDIVYDGTRYAYVSCDDRNIYRVDMQAAAGAPAGVITGVSSRPWGLAMLSGTLYVIDRSARTLRRASSPATATSIDSFNLALAATDPVSMTPYSGKLYVADLSDRRVVEVNPSTSAQADFVTELNGGPSRIRTFNNGNLLVRASDGVYYTITTTGAVSQYRSTIGCTGCGVVEFLLDSANTEFNLQPRQHLSVRALGIMNTRELARDGSWLYVAATHGLVGFDLATGEEVSVSSIGRPSGLAVDPANREIIVVNTGGTLYTIDFASRTRTSRPGLGTSGWGLDYHSASRKLFASSPSTNRVYRIDRDTFAATAINQGLHNPMF